ELRALCSPGSRTTGDGASAVTDHRGPSGRARGSAGRPPADLEMLLRQTPEGRDRYLDLLRVLSLGAVIIGHWLMAVVVFEPDGRAVTSNALAFLPWAAPVTWLLQVMSLFFFVGGAAHWYALRGLRARGGHSAEFVSARVTRLMWPTGAFLAVWVVVAVIAHVTGLHDGVVGVALRIAAQPLWFLAVYLGVILIAIPMLRLHDRFGVAVPVVMLALVAVADIGRIGFDLWYLGIANYVLCWALCHQLGYLYADGSLTRSRRSTGPLLFVMGLSALIALTTFGPYPVSMVGLPGAPFSNISPPSLALLVQASMLVGLVLIFAEPAGRWLVRPMVWIRVAKANAVAMTAFLWHLTAAFVVVGSLLLLGIGLPEPGSAAWWLSRPGWLAVLACVTTGLVVVFRRFEPVTRPPRVATARGAGSVVLTVAGTVFVAVGVLGYAVHGFLLEGGRSLRILGLELNTFGSGLAVVCGWLLVYAATRPVVPDTARPPERQG
ncbi:MAG TPA: acyltransferase, partial [Actinopolymorphaceae bacterium]